MFVLHGHRLCRDIAVVLISSVAIWISDILLCFTVKLETGDPQDLKYEVYRIIGSGATVQSVSRVKTATPLIPRKNEEAATLESFDQRVKLFVSSTKEERYLCGPRLLSTFEEDTFRYVRDKLTDVQLEAADGSGALRRNYGETMRHWTRRFTLQYSKVGHALNASNAEINKGFSARKHSRYFAG